MPSIHRVVIAGGKVGHGRQGISWIHELDMNRLFERAINVETMSGAYLAPAPQPVSDEATVFPVAFGTKDSSFYFRTCAPLSPTCTGPPSAPPELRNVNTNEERRTQKRERRSLCGQPMRALVEQFFDRDGPRNDALLVRVLHDGVEHAPVRLEPIGQRVARHLHDPLEERVIG